MAEIYLDNAATSFPKPEPVYQAIENFMRRAGGSPARGSYTKAQESERIVVKLRSKLAGLLGISNPSDLAFTVNSTDALNLALKGWLSDGDHVVITDLEHNALLRPLWGLRRSRNIEVSVVRSDARGLIHPDEMMKAVTPKTRLLTCVHASNVLGTLQPIAEIAQRCRQANIPFLVDGSQTVGAYPVNLEELDVDMFAFTGHKSLLGPTGTGGLYLRPGIDLEPFREGGSGSHSQSLEQPTTRPERYESGTPNMLGLAGLLAGVEYLQDKGIPEIRKHEVALNQRLMNQLREIEGVSVFGPEADEKVAITSIGFKNLDPVEAGQILSKKFGIMVRTGLHCSPLVHENIGTHEQGTVRFSVGWSNTPTDIEAAVSAVREISKAVYRRSS